MTDEYTKRSEALRDTVRRRGHELLERDKSGKGWICPICGSGGGRHGTGMTSRDGVHFTCWACDSKPEDIIGIVQKRDGVDYVTALRLCCEWLGLMQEFESLYGKKGGSMMGNSLYKAREEGKAAATKPPADYTAYYEKCAANIENTDYWRKRGLSLETVKRFRLGFDGEWRHPKAVAEGKKPPATPRMIIPTSKHSYIARDTREVVPAGQESYKKQKCGESHLFNADAVKEDAPVFVVEGEFDALSVIEAGGSAMALGGIGNVKKFLAFLDRNKPKRPLIISLDKDEAGKRAELALCEGLGKLGIAFYRADLGGTAKDANERLIADREGLEAAVADAIAAAKTEQEAYSDTTNAGFLQAFLDGVADSVSTPCYSTGFKKLDDALDGGLYEGLTIIGAITSLGKTAFALQIADSIAAAGGSVLVFSLEMGRNELMARTISRETWKLGVERGDVRRLAKTARGVLDGRRYANYAEDEEQAIYDAVGRYGDYAGNVRVIEGLGNVGAAEIREEVQRHIRLTGQRPFVLIDYLQLVCPADVRMTDKQSVDHNVMEFKRLSRDTKTCVFVVSSLNRQSYNDEVNLQSFKESGGIEYSADLVLALQLSGAGQKDFDATAEKAKNPRKIELRVLKNRNAAVGSKVHYDYYPAYNTFVEADY